MPRKIKRAPKDKTDDPYYGRWCSLVNRGDMIPIQIDERHLPPLVTDCLVVASIDPGRENYALRIGSLSVSGVKTLLYVKFSVTKDPSSQLYQLTRELDKYKSLFMQCHYVIMEKQMFFNGKIDRIGDHTISYFLIVLRESKLRPRLIEFSSKLKTRFFLKDKSADIKKWSAAFFRAELVKRGDLYALDILDKAKKKDDYADVGVEEMALHEILGVSPSNVEGWIEPEFRGCYR